MPAGPDRAAWSTCGSAAAIGTKPGQCKPAMPRGTTPVLGAVFLDRGGWLTSPPRRSVVSGGPRRAVGGGPGRGRSVGYRFNRRRPSLRHLSFRSTPTTGG